MLTVDQMGWERGYPLVEEDPLDDELIVNPDGDYAAGMTGTSAAAPQVSGAVAVLLEAVPELTWRDVKHVLANSARRIDPNIEAVERTIGGSTRTLRPGWTENAAGYEFHNWYGFGALDLDAALRFARGHTPDSLGEFRQSGWFDQSTPLEIPDYDANGVTQTIQISGLPEDATIEAVLLEFSASHEYWLSELGIHLVSPRGTRSVVNQVFNDTLYGVDEVTWRILSNAFYGENPNGGWTIEVFDASEFDTGDLHAWRLRFYYGDHSKVDSRRAR